PGRASAKVRMPIRTQAEAASAEASRRIDASSKRVPISRASRLPHRTCPVGRAALAMREGRACRFDAVMDDASWEAFKRRWRNEPTRPVRARRSWRYATRTSFHGEELRWIRDVCRARGLTSGGIGVDFRSGLALPVEARAHPFLRHHPQEVGVGNDVPAPQPARLLDQPEKPLQPEALHRPRSAADAPRDDVEAASAAHAGRN